MSDRQYTTNWQVFLVAMVILAAVFTTIMKDESQIRDLQRRIAVLEQKQNGR